MTLRGYLFLVSLNVLISLLALVFIIFNYNPFQINFWIFFIFYFFIFVFSFGIFFLLFLKIRLFFKNDSIITYELKTSLREGFLCSVFCITILIMFKYKFLSVWNFILVTLLFCVVEVLFIQMNLKSSNINELEN